MGQPRPRSVRLSVTDRCDFACTYCRPRETELYVEHKLSVSEWGHMIDGLRRSGVVRFRLTGGEPLVSPLALDIVRLIAASGATDVALTTNASQLARLAEPLKKAGLRRINISIDSLCPDRFAAMTRGGRLAQVLAGIEAARAVGFAPIKLNTVVLRGQNDDELASITEFAWERGLVPRFLELMTIGEGARLPPGLLVTVAEMRERLRSLIADGSAEVEPDRGPARYVGSRAGSRGERRVGFISGASDTYCAGCDRLRVSAEGMLRPCLASEAGVSARTEVERGDAEAVARQVTLAWRDKPDGAVFRGCTEESAGRLSMRAIGG